MCEMAHIPKYLPEVQRHTAWEGPVKNAVCEMMSWFYQHSLLSSEDIIPQEVTEEKMQAHGSLPRSSIHSFSLLYVLLCLHVVLRFLPELGGNPQFNNAAHCVLGKVRLIRRSFRITLHKEIL